MAYPSHEMLGVAPEVAILGILGGILFFGRFYVQWIVSEIRKESVIPMAFWYMSLLGSMMLFPYAFARVSPGGTLGLCFNAIIYVRNLVYRWREAGTLTPLRSRTIHALAGILVLTGSILALITWRRDYHSNSEFWVWSTVWAAGQGLMFLRFLSQWLITEVRGKSIVPRVFWQLSIAATVFHTGYFLHRGDSILVVGTVADAFVYVRNLYLIRSAQAMHALEKTRPPDVRESIP